MRRAELEVVGVLLAVLGLLSTAGAAPAKSARTLITDDDLAGWRAAPDQWAWLLKDGNAGYPMMYTGMRPIGRWRDKSDEWLWHLMLPTTVRRASGVGCGGGHLDTGHRRDGEPAPQLCRPGRDGTHPR